jgi:hypothetical protein
MTGMHTKRWNHLVAGAIILALLQSCAWFHKPGPPPLVGTWTNPTGTLWMIKADGTFDVDFTKNGQRDAWGKYTVDGDTVTLVAVGGMKPKGCDGEGIYNFKRNGNALSFTLVNDTCKLRKKNVLLPWRLKK